MPIYEYECGDCKTRIETLKSLNDASAEICAVCKKEMKKLISRSSFSLKGEGWYRDGYHKSHVTFRHKNGETKTVPYNANKVPKE